MSLRVGIEEVGMLIGLYHQYSLSLGYMNILIWFSECFSDTWKYEFEFSDSI
jgi:hypothetical protein